MSFCCFFTLYIKGLVPVWSRICGVSVSLFGFWFVLFLLWVYYLLTCKGLLCLRENRMVRNVLRKICQTRMSSTIYKTIYKEMGEWYNRDNEFCLPPEKLRELSRNKHHGVAMILLFGMSWWYWSHADQRLLICIPYL